MVKQHLFKLQAGEGHTIAMSGSIHENKWLPMLEQQLSRIASNDLSVPAFYQYVVGDHVVVSRCMPDPSGTKDSALMHQLIFDDEQDLRTLRHIRPISVESFFALRADGNLLGDALNAASGDHALELRRCFHTLQFYFDKKESVLAAFIGAVTFCARDHRQSVRVLLSDTPEQVSQVGHDLMELLLRVLRPDDAARVSYASLLTEAAEDNRCTVTFSPRTSRRQLFPEGDILLDLTAGNLILPRGVFLPNAEQNARIALAMLAKDLSRVDGISGNTDPFPVYPHVLPMIQLPVLPETSLEQYFSDWQHLLLLRFNRMSRDAFRKFALSEWQQLIGAVINAADCLEPSAYLSALHSVILQAQSYMPEGLEPTEDVLTDLKILLLDGVNWDTLDLSHLPTLHLLQKICIHSLELTDEENDTAEYTLSCRVLHHMLHSPIEMDEALLELAHLQRWQPKRFKQLQQCMMRCVERRLNADFDIIDEKLVACAILGTAQFNEGIPDLRRLSDMATQIETRHGLSAARRFEHISDRMRGYLHMPDSFIFHRGELKHILLGCCVLGAAILGITAWYYFF